VRFPEIEGEKPTNLLAADSYKGFVEWRQRRDFASDSTARRLVSRLERIGFEVAVRRASQPKVALPKEKAARPGEQKETTVPPGKCRKCSQWGLADCIHIRPKGLQIRQERSASSTTDSIT